MRRRTEAVGAALAVTAAATHVAVVPHLPLWSQLAMAGMLAACVPCVASLVRAAATGSAAPRRTWLVVLAMGLTMLALHAVATGTTSGAHAMHEMHDSPGGSVAMWVANLVALAEVLAAGRALADPQTAGARTATARS